MTADVTGGAGPPAPPDVPSSPSPHGGGPARRFGGRATALLFNVRVLRIAGQVAAIVVLLVLAAYLADNYR
ncbi:MAG TPA: hypothetical protein VFB94_03395, partial [Acidimicrobiales bacterium]|nr:hypothetical protein [Acidimicrobiales bacterium]